MILFFWILIGIILYTYLGYTLILLFFKIFISEKKPSKKDSNTNLPEITLLVAAYNEADIINQKLENTFQLDYPADKLKLVWITDGSTDDTAKILSEYQNITILHSPERKGKTAAINRALEFIQTPLLVLCDANTMLDNQAIKELVKYFSIENVGCVAGRKQIARHHKDMAAGSGEGGYWQYESFIKQLESDVNSTLGAAGELYAIRTNLFKAVAEDTIIDDFVISLTIATQGYKIKYAKKAISTESASLNVAEELKRKIRIASGGFQTLFRYPALLNIFKYGTLSFQYFSHKVLRWALAPFAIFLTPLINLLICIQSNWQLTSYNFLLGAQFVFSGLVIIGSLLEKKNIRFKSVFLPFYLIVMNYAQIAGLIRYLRKKQSVIWEKAKRKS